MVGVNRRVTWKRTRSLKHHIKRVANERAQLLAELADARQDVYEVEALLEQAVECLRGVVEGVRGGSVHVRHVALADAEALLAQFEWEGES